MQQLNKQLVSKDQLMDHLPERIIQFGEGNFLRGFIDWMVHLLNKKGLFNGRIVAIQPTPHGKVVPVLNAQEGLYTLVLKGIEQEKLIDQAEIITSISRGINPYAQWEEVLKVAENPQVEFVFSNTTEAGLTYVQEDYQPSESPLSFPGKLTAFLYHRYTTLGDSKETGMKILPCELVENNGDLLREIVLKIATDWKLPQAFLNWVQEHNHFCNTLVDRIVTGFPRDHIDEYIERLGYEDKLLTVGEPYHLFAIDANEEVANSIPFHKAGLNVHWTDVKPFREVKVRILNGAHTLMVPVSFLAGKDTVLEAIEDPLLRQFIWKGIYQEIFPNLDIPVDQKKPFADSVIERFLNPFNKHFLRDIALNSFYKFRTRLLPTLMDMVKNESKVPDAITFSLAALFVLYRGERTAENEITGHRGDQPYTVREQVETISFIQQKWQGFNGDTESLRELVSEVLANTQLWGTNLNDIPALTDTVYKHLVQIIQLGINDAVVQFVQGE